MDLTTDEAASRIVKALTDDDIDLAHAAMDDQHLITVCLGSGRCLHVNIREVAPATVA